MKIRALGISTDLDTVNSLSPPLRLYPDLVFTGTVEEGLNTLFYIRNNEQPISTSTLCSADGFTLGVWRRSNSNSISRDDVARNQAYMKVGDLSLVPCDAPFVLGTVCCEFEVPSGVAAGDVLGILHGQESSLLHEVSGDPSLKEVLFGEDVDPGETITLSENQNLNSQGGYPLLSFTHSEQ